MKKMKTAKANKTVLEIIWDDASCERGWGADPKGMLYKVCSVGVLTNVTDTHIALALQFSETGNHAEVLSIPKGMVRSVRKVGIVRGF